MDAVRGPPDLQQPPEVPEVPRRIRLDRHQWIGVGVMILIPILALLELFGERRARAQAETGEILMEVEYPEVLRKGQRSHLEVRIDNRSERFVDAVTPILDAGYLKQLIS